MFPDTLDRQEILNLLSMVFDHLAEAESYIATDWKMLNQVFSAEGKIAECLRSLHKPLGHDLLSVNEAVLVLKSRYLWYITSLCGRDVLRELHGELSDVLRLTSNFADELRTLKLAGSVIDFAPVLGALAALSLDAEKKRTVWTWTAKRGPKNARAFVDEVIVTIEIFIGDKIKRSDKAETPAEALRNIIGIMDPDIGAGTIDEALKARSKALGEITR